jgi:glutamate-5-semialdehyde dehydrogenase
MATATTAQTDLVLLMRQMGQKARAAAAALVRLTPEQKNEALARMADGLRKAIPHLKEENAKDLKAGEERGLAGPKLKRLELNDRRLGEMIQALEDVQRLPDPVGEIIEMSTRPSGLRVGRMRAPIGVIAIVYESRPNVTSDASSLCLKSGNAVILRGGSEAIHSNSAITDVLRGALEGTAVPPDAIQLVPTTDREAIGAMLGLEDLVDVVIPRGGRGLIEMVLRDARMPVLKHLDGNCHVYIDEHADLEMAKRLTVNAKTQYPAVCNAAESLLVHRAVAETALPPTLSALIDAGVEIRGDETVCKMEPRAKAATMEDWDTEYLDLILSVKVVDSLDEAVGWINTHGSHHTDAIVTRDHGHAMRFLNEVDSASVFVNASTRWADGARFGLGCEIGISTDKLHARGPMGLRELTTAKWIGLGDGQEVI